jgi:hypothetical protein
MKEMEVSELSLLAIEKEALVHTLIKHLTQGAHPEKVRTHACQSMCTVVFLCM